MATGTIKSNRLRSYVLYDYYGNIAYEAELSDSADNYELLVFEVTDGDNMVCAGYTSHPYIFRNKTIKLYGSSSAQWGSCLLSSDYRSATFNRTSANTTHTRLLGLRKE